MKEILPKIFLYKGSCNTYYIDGKKKILIDAGFFVDKKVDIIIITHAHPDHILFAQKIKERDKCRVLICKKERILLKLVYLRYKEWFGIPLEKVKIDEYVKEGDIIDAGDYKLRVIETPGHSPGSISLFDEEKKIIFSGDTLFAYGGIGRTDIPFGNEKDIQSSLEKIVNLKPKYLFPGHGHIQKFS